MQPIPRLEAKFVEPLRAGQVPYTLTVWPDIVNDVHIAGTFEAAPHGGHDAHGLVRRRTTFRRADGRQIVTDKAGHSWIGGWRIDPRALTPTATLSTDDAEF